MDFAANLDDWYRAAEAEEEKGRAILAASEIRWEIIRWLEGIPIAWPVLKAFREYEEVRKEKMTALSNEHFRVARGLRASARNVVSTDEGRGDLLASNTPFSPNGGGGPRTSAPFVPAGSPNPNGTPTTPAPSPNGRGDEFRPGVTPFTIPGANGDGSDRTRGDDRELAANAPTGPVALGQPGGPPGSLGGLPAQPGASIPTSSTAGAPTTGDPDQTRTGTPTSTTSGVPGATPAAASTPTGVVVPPPSTLGTPPATPDERASSVSPPPTVIPPPPFAAAVAAAKDRAAEPSFVVGSAPDDDLVLAKTVLAGILAVARSGGNRSAAGLDVAVSVTRGPGGRSVFVTSNEGRGWIPAGLWLPEEVAVPWNDNEPVAWESVADPARVLAESALARGRDSGERLTALVSSRPIEEGVRAALGPEVSVADSVSAAAAETTVFHEPAEGLKDRLALLPGWATALASVPPTGLAGGSLDLADEAHRRVVEAVGEGVVRFVSDVNSARELRARILRVTRDGEPIPPDWWDELRTADILIDAAAAANRMELGQAGIGEVRDDPAADVLRALTFERRCNELVLLLEDPESDQRLRDSVYAYAQIVAHPLFPADTAPQRPAASVGPDAATAAPRTAAAPKEAPVPKIDREGE